ncbi:hypothetical protein ACKLTP_17210, partial [Paenarthrobacter ureafaciens]|uniref:hypothetical protein n=1 Tax=Paenarthrobacter ureafaciens TaxID=37931 RepID=UPI003978B488
MGLSGQVVVERAGTPGAAAANGDGPPGAGSSGGAGGAVEDVMEALEGGAAVLEAARALALPAGRVFDVQEAAESLSILLCMRGLGSAQVGFDAFGVCD